MRSIRYVLPVSVFLATGMLFPLVSPAQVNTPPEKPALLQDIMAPSSADTQAPRPTTAEPDAAAGQSLLVPVETVMYIRLGTPLSSEKNHDGDVVSATVDQPVNLGPYTAIPTGSQLQGKIAHINNKSNSDGYNPYVVVHFDTLKRPEDKQPVPFDGNLVTYKTGLNKQDYVWRLPLRGDRKRGHLRSIIGGAVTGAMFNPFFGPPIGAGLGWIKSGLTSKMAENSTIELKTDKVLPISVGQAFTVPMTGTAVVPPGGGLQPESTSREATSGGKETAK